MAHKPLSWETQEIKNEVLLLSSMIEEAIMDSVGALKNHDLTRSAWIIQNDLHINQKGFEIEISIIVLMATQQPIARELRTLTASLAICSELERMEDYAKGIANINLRSQGLSLPGILRDLYTMAEKAVDMLHRAMTTFAAEDIQTATAIIREGDGIDECYNQLYAEAMKQVLGDPRDIDRANYVIWTAHNLERLGDRVTNVCERVIYIVTGELLEESSLPAEFGLSSPEN
jgi:phosphate transport system protein